MHNQHQNLTAALDYLEQGYSVIPVGRDKKPLIKWQEFQKRCPTANEIQDWFTKWPDANVGIVTGKISGLVVVDVDTEGPVSVELPPTRSVCTSRGCHHYYRYPDGNEELKNQAGVVTHVDIRGDGGYVIAPPSIHSSGKQYAWIDPDQPLADLPVWVTQPAQVIAATDEGVVPEGKRNDAAARQAGKIFRALNPEDWEGTGWPELQKWNQEKCRPPLDEGELRSVWDSIAKRAVSDDQKDRSGSQAQRLLALLEDEKVEFFIDDTETPFIHFRVNDHLETWPCNSGAFKRWLRITARQKLGAVPNGEILNTVIQDAEAQACMSGVVHPLSLRVARQDGVIYYDLCNKDWHAVAITAEGWQIQNHPPTVFRRFPALSPQVPPVRGGTTDELLKFINVTNQDDQLLLLVWVVSCFIPDFPHPAIIFHGAQGSGKSSATKIIHRIIDPSKTEAIAFPDTLPDLQRILSHAHVPSFDNSDGISKKISDELSRLITGGWCSKRELFTTNDDHLVHVRNPCIINGINIAATAPDLLERSIIIGLERVETQERREESKLFTAFEEVRPRIVGAIFDTIAKTLSIYPTVQIVALPRMADFAVWGEAIAQAFGYEQGTFLSTYQRNIAKQTDEVIANDSTADAVVRLLDSAPTWTGTATQLLQALQALFSEQELRGAELPKSASALSRKLNTLKTVLAEAGVQVEIEKGKARSLQLRKLPENAAPAAATSRLAENEAKNTGDISDAVVDMSPPMPSEENVANQTLAAALTVPTAFPSASDDPSKRPSTFEAAERIFSGWPQEIIDTTGDDLTITEDASE